MITITEIKDKTRRYQGQVWKGMPLKGHQAEIEPGVSIRLTGTEYNRINPEPFDKTFKIGDWAEYDSYNLKYDGVIISITAKTVTIQSYPGSNNAKNHRLTIHGFSRRNWNFDKVKVDAYNSDEMMYI